MCLEQANTPLANADDKAAFLKILLLFLATRGSKVQRLAWFRRWGSQNQTQDYILLPIVPHSGTESFAEEFDNMSYGIATRDYVVSDPSENATATLPLLRGDNHRGSTDSECRTDGGHASIASCVGNLTNTIIGQYSQSFDKFYHRLTRVRMCAGTGKIPRPFSKNWLI